MTVIVVTVAALLRDTFTDFAGGTWREMFKRHFGDCVVVAALGWYAARGGKVSNGCFAILYALAGAALVAALAFFAGVSIGLREAPAFDLPDVRALIEIMLILAWSVFSFWVLVFSEDAALYRDVRRRGVTAEEYYAMEMRRTR